MEAAKSFGSQFAGADFNLVEFIQRPQTIVRLLCWLFAIIVFGCIASEGYDDEFDHCVFHKNDGACHYGVGIGVIAFLACMIFLVIDSQFNNLSNADIRKKIVMVDLFYSGLWTFLWFVCFCFLADMWRRSSSESLSQHKVNNARSAIVFSFFSIFTWGGLTSMALSRYRQGTTEFGGNTMPGEGGNNTPYASFPTPAEDREQGYQSQPFNNPQQPVQTEYNVPTY